MARWVVNRPGAGGGAAESTDFSEWIQVPDRQAPMSPDARWLDDPTRVADGDSFWEYVADGPTPAETYPDDISELATSLMAGWGQVAGGPGAGFHHNWWAMISGTAPGGDDDPFYFTHGYGGSRGGTRVAPFVRTADLHWQDSWRPAAWPDGAIGYEVEAVDLQALWPNPAFDPEQAGTPGYDVPEFFVLDVTWALSEPTALDLTVSLQTATGVGTNGGSIGGLLTLITVSGEWGGGNVLWHSDPGSITYFDIDGAHPNRVSARREFGYVEHPVIGSGTEQFPTEYNFRIDDFTGAPAHTGLVGLSVGMSKDSLNSGGVSQVIVDVGENGRVDTSEGLNYWGTYTIRPPRFRWIFGEAAPAAPDQYDPYRRTFPRDDQFGTSAPRTFPESRSEQGSNRTFSGYL